MNKTFNFFLAITLANLMVAEVLLNKRERELLQKVTDYKGRKTFLLSYPCSGNTWTRYCLEYLTQRPTFNAWLVDRRNIPIGWQANFEVNLDKAPILKAHRIETEKFDKDTDQLILIVRNPKEAIRRAEYQLDKKEHLSEEKKGKIYFDNLATFDSWNSENRILIYYEDLITNPESSLEKLLLFLDESPSKLPLFMQDYHKHQHNALEIYYDSYSKGRDLLYHSRKIDPDLRKQIDQWIEELYPLYWNKYLKDRFSEAVINY